MVRCPANFLLARIPMMKRLLLRCVVLVLLTAPMARAQRQLHSGVRAASDSTDAFARRIMRERRIPGMQVAVVQHGKIVLARAYGIANVEDSVPVTSQTVFPIASVTKAFTGVAIMQLVEAGKLDLSAPISRYVDSLPATWQVVNVRQLLTHMSGLPDIWDADARMIAPDPDTAWAMAQARPVAFVPGERFQYVQTNYVLLGKIIERLSGEPFMQFVRDRQMNVVGMPNSGFGDSWDVVPRSARTYWFFENAGQARLPTKDLRADVRNWPAMVRPAVGVNTTATELARWVIAVQGGKLLKASTSLTTMWTAGVLNDGSHQGFSPLINGYALGWPVVIRPQHRAIAPTGGGKAAVFIYPNEDLAVVVLTNLFGAAPQSFVDELAGYFRAVR